MNLFQEEEKINNIEANRQAKLEKEKINNDKFDQASKFLGVLDEKQNKPWYLDAKQKEQEKKMRRKEILSENEKEYYKLVKDFQVDSSKYFKIIDHGFFTKQKKTEKKQEENNEKIEKMDKKEKKLKRHHKKHHKKEKISMNSRSRSRSNSKDSHNSQKEDDERNKLKKEKLEKLREERLKREEIEKKRVIELINRTYAL